MSTKEPGIMFDATRSWNGYNHQGKIAIWYAIGEVTRLIDSSLSHNLNRLRLANHFLEIEYMEDFSIGKTNSGGMQYQSVHQVKDQQDSSIDSYESAFLGLVKHLSDDSGIANAYLHLTTELNMKGKPLIEHLTQMVANPVYLTKIEEEINANRNDPQYREKFLVTKKGRPTSLKSELLHALSIVRPLDRVLTDTNLDCAFDQLLLEIDKQKKLLQSMTANRLSSISVFSYPIGSAPQMFCKEDQVENLLKQQLKSFYLKLDPKSYKTSTQFVDKSYLFVLGKLDEHIIERSLNYNAYKIGQLGRQISFSTIYDWLVSDEINSNDKFFYLYHIKEKLFASAERYCKACKKKEIGYCSECQVPLCKDMVGSLGFEELQEFLCITNPHISKELDVNTYGDFSSSPGINNPFFAGLRDIEQAFFKDKAAVAITYRDSEKFHYALTAIAPLDTDDDTAIICSEIIKNRNIYSLLMDYDYLISKDISVSSIQDEEITQSHRYDAKMSEHIAHCKDVKITPLNTCIPFLLSFKENEE